jgi:hypothetical protein
VLCLKFDDVVRLPERSQSACTAFIGVTPRPDDAVGLDVVNPRKTGVKPMPEDVIQRSARALRRFDSRTRGTGRRRIRRVGRAVIPDSSQPADRSAPDAGLQRERGLDAYESGVDTNAAVAQRLRLSACLFIEDGSSDDSWAEDLRDSRLAMRGFRGIRLSRNYGSHIALSAGFANIGEADAVATLALRLCRIRRKWSRSSSTGGRRAPTSSGVSACRATSRSSGS